MSQPERASAEEAAETDQHQPPSRFRFLKSLGPGILSGLADDDPAGVATYAIVGATTGYAQLWLLVVATFIVQAVQVTSARLGEATQCGVLRATRRRYGLAVAVVIGLIGIVANEATLMADAAAVGVAFELITGLPWQWFVAPTIVALFLVTVFLNFKRFSHVMMFIGLLLLSYVVTAFLARPDWGLVLRSTVIPVLPRGLDQLRAAVALLGTTVSPYLIFWEAEGEKEDHRTLRQFSLAQVDITVGFIASDIVSFFIIVTTAATLFVNHQSIQTAGDAALALRPLLGDSAEIIFALGLLATGLVAIPFFAITTGYIVANIFEWPRGLSRRFREARGFYAVIGASFL
ncbi:MAG TPA: divalent metal cation transporter, partial [Chloroflexota bacterium]|nr:divalent metal cation transporter [Chloroflexota bacterium]